jgi:hypothetical protein
MTMRGRTSVQPVSGTFELRRQRHGVEARPVAAGRPPAVQERGREAVPAPPDPSWLLEVERAEAIALR